MGGRVWMAFAGASVAAPALGQSLAILEQSTRSADEPAIVGGAIQFRAIGNWSDTIASEQNITTGIQGRLHTLWFTGTIEETWSYRVQANFPVGADDTFILEDAVVTHRFDENFAVGAGQFTLPMNWEDIVQRWHHLVLEPSPTNTVFSLDRTQGVYAHYQGEDVRLWGALGDGAVAANADFDSAREADISLTGRIDYMWAGSWDQFRDFTSFRGSPRAARAGLAFHYQTGGHTAGSTSARVYQATVDMGLEGSGWNAFAAAHIRRILAGGRSLDEAGFVAQAGVFLNEHWEGYVRYDVSIPDDDRGSQNDPFNTVTVGVNRYLIPESHAAKLSLDVILFIDPQTSGIQLPFTTQGLLLSGAEGQFALRAQLQVVF